MKLPHKDAFAYTFMTTINIRGHKMNLKNTWSIKCDNDIVKE